jgi:hypothetical protein
MFENLPLRRSLIVGVLASAACLAQFAQAQPAAKDDKAAFNKAGAKDAGLGMPTPYDKFLALDQALTGAKVDWAQTFRKVAVDIDADALTDKDVAIPMALGVRIADGVMAVKAHDAELLNKCAADIEKLAKKIGIADTELGRARAVRTAANKGEWMKVFMELGFFQQDIMKKIEDKEHATRGTLLIVSGWMQGARYTSTVIEDNYSPAASNILREPMLAKALMEKVDALPDNVKSSPLVGKVREVLPQIAKIIDIPLDGTIPKESVSQLNQLATQVVKASMGAPSQSTP